MRKAHKLTLAGVAAIIGIASGIITLMDKTIDLVTALKPEASGVPEKAVIESGIAGRIDKFEKKQLAKMSK